MAPTGQRGQISHIDDLDSAGTGTKEYKREKSINFAAVFRPASCFKCVEHDIPNLPETAQIQQKLQPQKGEDVLEDGSQYYLDLPETDIECLGGVDSSKRTRHDSSSSVTSFDEGFLNKSFSRTWKSSSGKGKKRKKRKAGGKRKVHKRQKTDISMASANEMENMSCEDECKTGMKTVGDGKTNAKGGCITTPKPQSVVTGNGKECCSRAHTQRGGGGRDDGDDEDDDKKKPPRKPPEDMPFKKQKPKKKKASSGMDVDSEDGSNNNNDTQGHSPIDQEVVAEQQEQAHQEAAQPPQQQQPQQQASYQFLLLWHSIINHFTFCHARECGKCRRVELMLMQHYFNENNEACSCNRCQLSMLVLKFHSSKCQLSYCKVCLRAKSVSRGQAAVPVTPPGAAAAVQPSELNVPVSGLSLDPEEQIIWKEETFPKDVFHFKEDKDYICMSSVGKGGHGEVCSVEIPDFVKKKCFGTDCQDIVMKKSSSVGDDEKYVFQQTSQHPNFVHTYCVVQKQGNEHRTFMERCTTSLKDYLSKLVKEGKRLEIYEAMFYWSQVVDALKYLHHLRIPVIHKDVKAENVLLSVKDNMLLVKLADYDTVKQLHHAFTKHGLKAKGTPGLISPEVLRQMSHGRPADVYTMGMFLFQLLFPLDFTNLQGEIQKNKNNPCDFICGHHRLVQKFLNEKMPILRNIDEDLAELIQSCLEEDQSKRPTANEVLQHRAVTKYTKREINMRHLIEQIGQI